MTEPVVDVIVPIHRADRNVDVAASSAQSSVQGIPTRVLIVLHDLGVEDVERLRLAAPATLLHWDDGTGSPSGPRNAGLDATSAQYVFFLDSDDRLAPKCLRRLHEVAEITGADVVLPSLRVGRRYVGTPLAWSRRPQLLDVIRHDLFMRSNVPALIRRSAMDDLGIRYPEGVRTGEDFAMMAELFATATTSMAFDAVYDVLDGAAGRATTTPLAPEEELAALRLVLESAWIDDLPRLARDLLVRRILSVNLAGRWRSTGSTDPSRRREYRAVRDLALARAPGAVKMLSVRDRVGLRFADSEGRFEQALHSTPFGLVPTDRRSMLSARGPLIREARSWIVRHRRRNARLN